MSQTLPDSLSCGTLQDRIHVQGRVIFAAATPLATRCQGSVGLSLVSLKHKLQRELDDSRIAGGQ